uniref:Myb-like domain-containing protein n=1 Tax=Brassica oleracea var. oleracea TaxID=109376 RepID=A0A0D3DE50_BRAOL
MSLSPSSREINLASSSILDQSVAALEFHHLISSFYSEISSHLISSHRSRLGKASSFILFALESHLISSFSSEIESHLISSFSARLPPSFSLLLNLISSHRFLLRSNLISSHRSRLGKASSFILFALESHLISSFSSEIESHLISSFSARLPPSFSLLLNLISSHRFLLRSNLISSHRSRLGKNLISSQKRRRLEEKARIEGRMKLRQHARLAVMKVEEDEEEEEEEARSDCSCEFAFDSLRNQHKRQKWIHHHQSICILFQKATDPFSQECSFQNLLNCQPPNTSFSFLNCEPSIEVTSSDAKWAEYDIEDEHTVSDHKERRKWSPTEDIVLISAWLNTSKDPVVGNEQKAIAFWKQIAGYFASCPKVAGLQKRGATQCKQRWRKLNEGFCKFVGCFDAARKQKSSGQSEDGVLKMAHEIFFNDFKVKFTLEHAWLKLRHDQKWCGASETKDKVSSKRRKLNDQSQQSASSVPGCDGEDEASARPIGVKAAKGKGKSKAKTSDEAVEFQGI